MRDDQLHSVNQIGLIQAYRIPLGRRLFGAPDGFRIAIDCQDGLFVDNEVAFIASDVGEPGCEVCDVIAKGWAVSRWGEGWFGRGKGDGEIGTVCRGGGGRGNGLISLLL